MTQRKKTIHQINDARLELAREVAIELEVQNLCVGIYEQLDRAAKIRLLVRLKDLDLDAFLWAEAEQPLGSFP